MTFTANNYIGESCRIPIASLPAPLKKGHDLALKAFDKDATAYKSNDIVKTSMDHYLVAINEFMAKEQPIKSAPRKRKKNLFWIRPRKMWSAFPLNCALSNALLTSWAKRNLVGAF